jgi:hypothetical protein
LLREGLWGESSVDRGGIEPPTHGFSVGLSTSNPNSFRGFLVRCTVDCTVTCTRRKVGEGGIPKIAENESGASVVVDLPNIFKVKISQQLPG